MFMWGCQAAPGQQMAARVPTLYSSHQRGQCGPATYFFACEPFQEQSFNSAAVADSWEFLRKIVNSALLTRFTSELKLTKMSFGAQSFPVNDSCDHSHFTIFVSGLPGLHRNSTAVAFPFTLIWCLNVHIHSVNNILTFFLLKLFSDFDKLFDLLLF